MKTGKDSHDGQVRLIARVSVLIVVAAASCAFDASQPLEIGRLDQAITGPRSSMELVSQTTGGAAEWVTSTPLSRNRLVTASLSSSDELVITSWEVCEENDIYALGSASGGQAQEVAITSLGHDRVVTVARDMEGELSIVAWSIDEHGAVQVLGDNSAGAVSVVDIAAVGSQWVVTSLKQGNGTLKLIAWHIDDAGAITRRGSISWAVSVASAQLVRVPLGNRERYLSAAVIDTSSRLQIATWELSSYGGFTMLDSSHQLVELQGDLDLVGVSYGLIATAGTRWGNLKLQTWDIDDSGVISLRSQEGAGAVGGVAAASLSSTRVITALRQSDGNLKLISWDTIDMLERLGDATGGPVSHPTISILNHDQIVTAGITGRGVVELSLWRERAVSLLHRSYSFPSHLSASDSGLIEEMPRDPGPAEQSPVWDLRFDPVNSGSSVEPHLAVGPEHVLYIGGGGGMGVYDTSGNFYAFMNMNEFFRAFIEPTNPDGTVNLQSINRHLGLRTDIDTPDPVDPSVIPPTNPPISSSITEFYDTRGFYDPTTERFIILTAARAYFWYDEDEEMTPQDYQVRRYYAIAVSRTSNPLDGFEQYMSTESAYCDWPQLSTSNGLIIVTHMNGPAHAPDVFSGQNERFRPSVRLFSIEAMSAGDANPPSYKLYPAEVPHQGLGSVYHYGDTNGLAYILRVPGDRPAYDYYYFQVPSDLGHGISVQQTTIDVGPFYPSWPSTPAVYRNGLIHSVSSFFVAPAVMNIQPAQHQVRFLRVPIVGWETGHPVATRDSSIGYVDTIVEEGALEDPRGLEVTYAQPTVAVNEDGHVLIAFGRSGVLNPPSQTLYQEARYSVFYNDLRGMKRSRLLHPGLALKVIHHTFGDWAERVPTPSTHFDDQQSFNAAADPDGQGLWLIHSYAENSTDRFRPIIARVTP